MVLVEKQKRKLTAGIGDLHSQVCVGGSSRAVGHFVMASSMA
jgi:hypothetical protein